MGLTALFTKIFGGPAATVIDSVGGVLDKLTTTDQERLEAQKALLQIERQFQADMLSKLTDADVEFAKAQSAVIISEAKSESWIARNWRPMVMLMFAFIIGYNHILAPLFSLKSLPIVPDMWELLKLGIGGYVIGRSVEKISADVLPAIIAAKK